MKTFYKTKKDNLVVVIDDKEAIFFDWYSILTVSDDVDFVKSNMWELTGIDLKDAEKLFNKVKDLQLIEEAEWMKFFLNKKTYKISTIMPLNLCLHNTLITRRGPDFNSKFCFTSMTLFNIY